MKIQFSNITKYTAIAGLALSLGLPVLAQDADAGADKRPTPEERQAQREQARKEYLAQNPDLAKRLEEQRKERAAKRAEFLKENPDVAKRLEERQKEQEVRREEQRLDREAQRVEREQRFEEFMANNPERAEEIQQHWQDRQTQREEFRQEHPEFAERYAERRQHRPDEGRGMGRGGQFNRGGPNRGGR